MTASKSETSAVAQPSLPCTGGVWVKKSARVSELKYQRGLPTHFIGTYQRGLLTQCQSSIMAKSSLESSSPRWLTLSLA